MTTTGRGASPKQTSAPLRIAACTYLPYQDVFDLTKSSLSDLKFEWQNTGAFVGKVCHWRAAAGAGGAAATQPLPPCCAPPRHRCSLALSPSDPPPPLAPAPLQMFLLSDIKALARRRYKSWDNLLASRQRIADIMDE